MTPALIALLLAAIQEAPTLVADAEAVFNSVAHGEGGITKIAAVTSTLAQLAGSAATAAASAAATGAKAAPQS